MLKLSNNLKKKKKVSLGFLFVKYSIQRSKGQCCWPSPSLLMEAHAESFIHEKGLTQHTLKEHMGRFFLKTFGYALHGENKNLCGISLIKYIFN